MEEYNMWFTNHILFYWNFDVYVPGRTPHALTWNRVHNEVQTYWYAIYGCFYTKGTLKHPQWKNITCG
jgi:hypothetical protein